MRFLVPDPCPGIPLSEISPLHARARAWLSRIALDPTFPAQSSVQIVGAAYIIDGLQYHHDRYAEHLAATKDFFDRTEEAFRLAAEADGSGPFEVPAPTPTERDHTASLDHEAIAYLNRLGQYYYFVKGLQRVPEIPRIQQLMVFRHKHTAHRSIDLPRAEDATHQRIQAMSFGFYRLTNRGLVRYQTVKDGQYVQFSVLEDHPAVMREATELLLSLHPAQ